MDLDNMNREMPPVSGRDYDFRPEPIEAMDAGEVEMAIANAMSGDPSHPYLNPRDGRHNAANAYVARLFERRQSFRPDPEEESRRLIQGEYDNRRREFERLRAEMKTEGFDVTKLETPDQVEELHLDLMRRDLQIQKGELHEAIPALRREISAVGLDNEPGLKSCLDLLELGERMTFRRDASGQTELDLSPSLKPVLMDAVFALQRAVGERRLAQLAVGRQKIAEVRRAKAAERAEIDRLMDKGT